MPEGLKATAGDPCPVCMPIGYLRLDCGGLSCSNCLWNSEEDTGRQATPFVVLPSGTACLESGCVLPPHSVEQVHRYAGRQASTSTRSEQT